MLDFLPAMTVQDRKGRESGDCGSSCLRLLRNLLLSVRTVLEALRCSWTTRNFDLDYVLRTLKRKPCCIISIASETIRTSLCDITHFQLHQQHLHLDGAKRPDNPNQLTLKGLRLEEFGDIVETYAAEEAFKLYCWVRDDDLRSAIYDYMHQGPLKLAEVIIIVQRLWFNGCLVRTGSTAEYTACARARNGSRLNSRLSSSMRSPWKCGRA